MKAYSIRDSILNTSILDKERGDATVKNVSYGINHL